MGRRGLTLAIRVTPFRPSVKSANAARGNHLAFLHHVTPAVTLIKQLQERNDAEEDGGSVNGERPRMFVKGLVPERRYIVIERCLRIESQVLGPPDSAIGDQDVNVADFVLDARGDGLEGGFRGDVADDGDDVAVGGFFGRGFEDFFAATDDVDFMRAVECEGFGHHQADAGATACNDGNEIVDVEQVRRVE